LQSDQIFLNLYPNRLQKATGNIREEAILIKSQDLFGESKTGFNAPAHPPLDAQVNGKSEFHFKIR